MYNHLIKTPGWSSALRPSVLQRPPVSMGLSSSHSSRSLLRQTGFLSSVHTFRNLAFRPHLNPSVLTLPPHRDGPPTELLHIPQRPLSISSPDVFSSLAVWDSGQAISPWDPHSSGLSFAAVLKVRSPPKCPSLLQALRMSLLPASKQHPHFLEFRDSGNGSL